MSKKIIAILLCLVMTVSLCGCGETTYTFDGVSGGPTVATSVENNNSNIVFVDGYAYYVGASRSIYNSNVFGEVTSGTIMRMNLSTGETVSIQPKLVADQGSAGLFIQDDKIYYTSPCDETDRDGSVQYSYHDIMVCDLDGSNPEKLYTFGTSAYVNFVSENGTVYAVYEDGYQLKAIDLSASNPSSTVIAEDYYSGVLSSYGVYVIRNEGWYQNVYSLSMTGEETLVISGKTSDSEKHDITILSIYDEKIYYSMADSVVKQNTETYACNLDGSNATKITSLSVSSRIMEYDGGYIFQVGSDIFLSKNGVFTLLDSSSAEGFKVEGGYLFTYTFDDSAYTAELYKLDIDAVVAGEEVEAELMFEADGDLMYESYFSALTFYDGVGYYYSYNSSTLGMACFDIDSNTSTSIAG